MEKHQRAASIVDLLASPTGPVVTLAERIRREREGQGLSAQIDGSRESQGLEPTITDPSTLAKIAGLICLPLPNGGIPKAVTGRKTRRGQKVGAP
jgi:hypothetical protein